MWTGKSDHRGADRGCSETLEPLRNAANVRKEPEGKNAENFAEEPDTAKLRIWMLRFWVFRARIAFRATGALWGRATPVFYHFSVHLSSVLGRTELCHEVWTPGPQKPQIISKENHHLALLERKNVRRRYFRRFLRR